MMKNKRNVLFFLMGLILIVLIVTTLTACPFFECSGCDGDGKCNNCDGTGEVLEYYSKYMEECKRCEGDGKCPTCGGAGVRIDIF
jgi:DnaJ-class molecular chaperone